MKRALQHYGAWNSVISLEHRHNRWLEQIPNYHIKYCPNFPFWSRLYGLVLHTWLYGANKFRKLKLKEKRRIHVATRFSITVDCIRHTLLQFLEILCTRAKFVMILFWGIEFVLRNDLRNEIRSKQYIIIIPSHVYNLPRIGHSAFRSICSNNPPLGVLAIKHGSGATGS